MPFKSKARERFFFSRLHSKNKTPGPSKEVAEKYIKDSEPKKERFSKVKKKLKKEY